ALALKGLQRLDEALAAMDRAIQQAPHLAGLYHARADLHLQVGNRPAARADFARAIDLEPGDSKSDRLIRSLLGLGELLHRQGKYSEALAQFDRALRLRDSYAETQRLRAVTLEALD